MLKVGQNVRVFGILKDSWILARVLAIETRLARILIEDWVGFPKNSEIEVSLDQVELISGGKL